MQQRGLLLFVFFTCLVSIVGIPSAFAQDDKLVGPWACRGDTVEYEIAANDLAYVKDVGLSAFNLVYCPLALDEPTGDTITLSATVTDLSTVYPVRCFFYIYDSEGAVVESDSDTTPSSPATSTDVLSVTFDISGWTSGEQEDATATVRCELPSAGTGQASRILGLESSSN